MRYVGGKLRLSKKIGNLILECTTERSTYIEPFVGGGAQAAYLGNHFDNVLLSDTHPDLILMWKHLNSGGEFPNQISEEEYKALKHQEPSAWRGIVGFGGSFGGKWFGGYARGNTSKGIPRNYLDESIRRVNKDIQGMQGKISTTFTCQSYLDITPKTGDVVYCDPPYANTLGYGSEFDSDQFWDTVESWSDLGAHVFVSEYQAPHGWSELLSHDLSVNVKLSSQGRNKQTEKLFVKD